MATNTLVCPFLDDDPRYAFGVEFGQLYAEMRDPDGPGEIARYFTVQNQDQILLAANRLGWTVHEIEPWGDDWFWCRMERGWDAP